MRLLRVLALASLLVLLAGCSGSPPATVEETGEEAAPEEGRSTGDADEDLVRVLDHEFDYDLNSAEPPTTMDVPANTTTLSARFTTSTSAPCGVTTGEPDDPAYPWVTFVSPSGKATELSVPAMMCRVAPLTVNAAPQTLALDAEAGTWQVSFAGRGLSAHAHLVVEAQLG